MVIFTIKFVQLVVISQASTCGDICSDMYREFYYTKHYKYKVIFTTFMNSQNRYLLVNSTIQNTTNLRKDGINPHKLHTARSDVFVSGQRSSMVQESTWVAKAHEMKRR